MKFLPASVFTKVSLVISIFCFSHLTYAQDEYKSNVIPPPPDAAALGKFVEIPVSYYTGIPQISIPIYTIRTGKLQVPVSLSYHAGGVKVEDISSRVGLGWALNAGGVISRSIVGCPDEGYDICSSFWDRPSIADGLTSEQKYDAVNGKIDMEPDMYFFNFNGHSGKLFFDDEGNCHTIPHMAIKIEPGIGPKKRADGSWKITTPDGVSYIFAAKETSVVATACGTSFPSPDYTPPRHVLAWYLTSITDPTGTRTITFNYSNDEKFNYSIGMNETYHIVTAGDTKQQKLNACVSFYNDFQPQRLESIHFDGGAMMFRYASRNDLKGSHRLYKIEIANTEETFYKRFDLIQSYFITENIELGGIGAYRLRLDKVLESSNDGTKKQPYSFKYNEFEGLSPFSLPSVGSKDQDFWGYYNGKQNLTTVPYIIYRNPLNGGKEVFYPLGDRWPHPEAVKAYSLEEIHYPTGGYSKFEYEINEVISDQLKNKTESEPIVVRASNSTPLEIPFSVNSFFEGGVVAKITFSRSLCNPNIADKEIANGYYNPAIAGSGYFAGIEREIGSSDPWSTDLTGVNSASLIYRNAVNTGSSGHVYLPPGFRPPIKGIAALPQYAVECEELDVSQCNEEQNYCPYVTLESSTDGVSYGVFTATDIPYRTYIKNGNYKLVVQNIQGDNEYDFRLEFYKEIDTPNKYAGGLRISRIINYDPDRNKEEVVNDFSYEDENGNSTGTVFFYQNIPYNETRTTLKPKGLFYTKRVLNSSSNCTLANTNGAVVGYKKVTVFNGENGINGKTEFYYTSIDDFPLLNPGNVAPYTPVYLKDWKHGLMDKKIVYKRTDENNYVEISEIDNHFIYPVLPEKVTGKKLQIETMVFNYIDDGEGNSSGEIPAKDAWTYYEGVYDVTSGWAEKDYTIEYLFPDDHLGDYDYAIKKRTDYVYNPINLQPQYIVTEAENNSDDSNEKNKQVIVYACDFPTTSNDFIEELNSNHIISIPIETVEILESTKMVGGEAVVSNHVLGGLVYTYKNDGYGLLDEVYKYETIIPNPLELFTFSNQSSPGILPWENDPSTFAIKSNYFLEHSFLTYDTYGNLLSEKGKDGITNSYEWDDTKFKLYPMQKIENVGSTNQIITNYTYKLHVGLLSQTDTNGKSISYEYDGLGRLKAVFDDEGNLVKKYEYQYKVRQ